MKKWKQTAGFTLVELIVVIAILGILAGVGTVGYSGYIKKANQAADEQLIAGVKNAIQLAAISELGTEQSGYVILSKEQDVDCGGNAFLESAMEDSFGSNWNKNHLKSDSWNGAAMLDTLDVYAASVIPSSYIQHSDTATLLNDVQNCATKLSGFLEELVGDPNNPSNRNDAGQLLAGFLGADRMAALMEGSGLAVRKEDGTYDYSNATSDSLANATVFCLANYLDSTQDAADRVAAGYWINQGPPALDINNDNLIYDVACWYAAMEGFLAYLGDEDLTQDFYGMSMTGTPGEILAEMSAMNTHIMTESQAPRNQERFQSYVASEQYIKDGEAFLSIMNTVNSLSSNYNDKDNLSDGSLFTGSEMLDDLNSYVGITSLAGQTLPSLQGSAVVIVITNDGSGNIILSECK